MTRKTTFPLALALTAAASAHAARASGRALSRTPAAPQSFEMSPGHFHFDHGIDLGPPGFSVGAGLPITEAVPEAAGSRFEPGVHYNGWRLPPERRRVAARKHHPAVVARRAPAPASVAPAPEESSWRRLRGWLEAARNSAISFARSMGWIDPEPAPDPASAKFADAERRRAP